MTKVIEIALDCFTAYGSLLIVVLGFYLVYGVMKVINMAHGDLIMLGCYITAHFTMLTGSFWIGAIISFFMCLLIGFLIEVIVIRHLYHKDNVMTLLATWGVSMIIIEFVRLYFGPSGIYVDPPFKGIVKIFSVPYSSYNFIIIGASAIFVTALLLLFRYTKFGVSLRAAIEDPSRAIQFSINVRKLYSLAFAFGAGLAGLAGAILSPISSITPNMGIDFAFLSFLVVICGGFRSFYSPIIGALIVACSKTILNSFYTGTISTVGLFIVVLIIIYIRPGGILAEKL